MCEQCDPVAGAFTYDLDGNMTQDGDYDYAWDGENRLIAVTPRTYEAGSKKLVFDYDYQSRRVRKRVYTYDGDEWLATPTTDLRFVYDGWNLLMELDGLNSNAVLQKYTWGLDLSGTLQGAGGVGGLLAVYDTAGTTSTSDDASYGYLYDTNGNVGQLVDFSDGSLAAKYEYDPYGGPLLDAANASVSGAYAATNPFRFSTKYFDGEVDYSNTANDGLYYYGYRYYSPRLGRWLSRDPIEERGAFNIYSSVQNDPTGDIDPVGLQPTTQPQSTCANTSFPPWKLPPAPKNPVIINNFAGALNHFINGGGQAAQLGQGLLSDLQKLGSFKIWIRKLILEGTLGAAQCGTCTKFPISDVQSGFITNPIGAGSGYGFNLNNTIGTIQSIEAWGDCTSFLGKAKKSPDNNPECPCKCEGFVICNMTYRLSDTYNFQGSNNTLLSWIPGTQYTIQNVWNNTETLFVSACAK